MAGNREVILKLELSAEEAAQFENRNAMVVPLADAEVHELRRFFIGISDFLRFNAKCLATLGQVVETRGDAAQQVEEIAKTLRQLIDPARVSAELHDRSRELLGRAVFVGPVERKDKLQ